MKKINALLTSASLIIIVAIAACRKPPPPVFIGTGDNNRSPVAKAGNDTSIQLPVNTVRLDGTGSFDPDSNSITYVWLKASGPDTYTIANPTSPVTEVSNLVQGTYQFVLTVTDSKGARANDLVNVYVQAYPAPSPYPRLEVDVRPYDTMVSLPAVSVSLSATASLILNNYGEWQLPGINSIEWSKVAGPASFNFQTINSLSTQVNGLGTGTYLFQCKVTDSSGKKDSASSVVSVSDPSLAEQEVIVSNKSWTDGGMGYIWLELNINQYLPADRAVRKVYVKQDCDSVFREAHYYLHALPSSRFAFSFGYINNIIMLYVEPNYGNFNCWVGNDSPDIKIIY